MKRIFIFAAVILLLIGFAGCDFGLNGINDSEMLNGGNTAKALSYEQHWKTGDGSINTWQTSGSGTYTVQWTDNIDSDSDGDPDDDAFVMVVGRGWTGGSANRVIHYYGDFNPNTVSYDGGGSDWENAYLSVYGWAHSNGELIEYYVLEGYGEFYQGKPGVDDSYGDPIGSYTSNGSTYHIVTKRKQDDNVDGYGWFRQIISIRENRVTPGKVDGIINFADHVAAWQTAGYTISDYYKYQMLAVEANNSNGSATITVEECENPNATTVSAYQRYENEFTDLGEKYLSTTSASNFWQSGLDLGYPTTRVGWTNGSSDSSFWQPEKIGSTDFYYIKNVNDGKYLTITITTTDTNKLVTNIAVDDEGNPNPDDPEFYINLYANPLFTDSKNPGRYGFRQQWSITTDSDSGDTVLKSRQNSDIAISLNETSGYAQGVPTSMLASKAVTINTKTFYEKWNVEEYPNPNAPAIPPTYKNLSNKWSGKRLTVTSSNNDAETRAQTDNASWTSQDWTFENVTGTPYYRIKNKWSGRYLNVRDDSAYAVVACYDLVSDWRSMQWIAEATGDGGYRFKNVWSGKYLTISNTSDYAEVHAQDLHTDWSSQVWNLAD